MAVSARGRTLHGVRVVAADLLPHVVHLPRETLSGEKLHAVTGEPGEDVVRLALQVVVDLLLEGLVLDRVDGDRNAGLLGEGIQHVLHGLERHRVRVIRAERDGVA